MSDLEIFYSKYRNATGMCSPDQGGSIGFNDMVWTAEEFMAKYLHRAFRPDDKIRASKFLDRSMVAPGLYHPRPGETDHNSHDNIRSMLMIMWISRYRHRITDFLRYGERTTFVGPIPFKKNYNNKEPGKFKGSTWMGRFPDIRIMAKLMVGKNPSILETLWWVLITCRTIFWTPKRVEPWKWAFYRYLVGRSKGGLFEAIADIWLWRFLKKKPGGIGQVIKEWGGPWGSHPSAHFLDNRLFPYNNRRGRV